MALPADCSVALLPIKPIYASAILAGTKLVEFRKTVFRRPITHVAVYASTPVQRIVGIFRVAEVEHAPPQDLWRRHGKHGGITSEAFDLYYDGAAIGLAFGVAEVVTLLEPIGLDVLGTTVTPPQSFRYLTVKEIARLRSALGAATAGSTRSNRHEQDQKNRRRRKTAELRGLRG
jgi:predicted transcriptional regulator